jgi:peptide deformylase
MAVREVLRMGDPFLLQRASEVTDFTGPALEELITDMLETMCACDGAGLAAPQIGVDQRVVIFGVESNPRYPDADAVPLTVLINPVITPVDEETDLAWEGCLSVPGMRGLVPRYSNIRYTGVDEKGNVIDRTVSGFHARVVQHECDHLDGILYPQRISDIRYFGFTEELFAEGSMGNPYQACEGEV